MKTDIDWMHQALLVAQKAQEVGEVPIGALIVKDNHCISEGYNRVICDSDPTAHAEIIALRDAGKALNNYRLPGCTLYVTLEPCWMCVMACVHARIDRIVFGAFDPKVGTLSQRAEWLSDGTLNHTLSVQGGICEDECRVQLKEFFKSRR